jgi:hypothetical protein
MKRIDVAATDAFFAHLKNKPAERHGLPSIIFNEVLQQAWPCPAANRVLTAGARNLLSGVICLPATFA